MESSILRGKAAEEDKKGFFLDTPVGRLHAYERLKEGEPQAICIDYVIAEGESIPLASV